MSRVTKSAGVTLGLMAPAALGVAEAGATEADADALSHCPANRLCLFEGGNYSSHHYRFVAGTNDRHYQDNIWYGTGDNQVDNDTSSLKNTSSRWVTVYRDAGYQSHSVCVEPGASVQNMSRFVITFFPNTTMDNKASSHQWGSTSGPANGRSNCNFIAEK